MKAKTRANSCLSRILAIQFVDFITNRGLNDFNLFVAVASLNEIHESREWHGSEACPQLEQINWNRRREKVDGICAKCTTLFACLQKTTIVLVNN